MRAGSVVKTGAAAGPVLGLVAAVFCCAQTTAHAQPSDPFVDAVVAFEPGSNAGFGAEGLPQIVLGPPRGAGETTGSLDVVALGNDGRIVVAFDGMICDRPGPDFTVFENAFRAGSPDGPVFAEVGIVSVSLDGLEFVEFPYDPDSLEGLAGRTPVLSHPDNGIDPTDPSVSGGDSFDLSDIGVATAAFIRITDPGSSVNDPGNTVPPGNSGGFDLDAIAAINPCPPVGGTTTTTTLEGTLCGNGIVEAGEACDSGAAAMGTGCSALCTPASCGDADANSLISAADAHFALRSSVGAVQCEPCICNVDGVGTITAVDALRILRTAVGILGSGLSCPACF